MPIEVSWTCDKCAAIAVMVNLGVPNQWLLLVDGRVICADCVSSFLRT